MLQDSTLPVLPCACANLRRATRHITHMYDEALRPTGLRATQFTLLQALSLAGEVTQNDLGELLAIDSTTLSRSLAPLAKQGWIRARVGTDRRQRLWSLTDSGKEKLQSSTPAWQQAQTELETHTGSQLWNDLFRVSNHVLVSSSSA